MELLRCPLSRVISRYPSAPQDELLSSKRPAVSSCFMLVNSNVESIGACFMTCLCAGGFEGVSILC